MEDFLRETLKSARTAADDFLSKLEKAVNQSEPSVPNSNTEDVYKNLYEEYRNRWEAVSDELVEAQTALKLFLDGEITKVFSVTTQKLEALDAYEVETFWTDPVVGPMELNVKQRKL